MLVEVVACVKCFGGVGTSGTMRAGALEIVHFRKVPGV